MKSKGASQKILSHAVFANFAIETRKACWAISPSLDDFRALVVQKLVAAIGAEELDFLVPEFLLVTIEFALALRTGHPKNFRHASVPRIFSRKDAKALSLGIKPIPKKFRSYLRVFAPLREPSLFV